jgi:hypothetical protein
MPRLKLTPTQTERGVVLHVELDEEELPSVWLTDGTPIVLDLPDNPDGVSARELAQWRKRQHRANKSMSNRQEQRIAKDLGGKRQPGSGAGKWNKGDVVRDGLARLEAKSTRAKSYTLTLDTLRKVVGEAKDGEIPAVVVHFFDGHTAVESVAVCPYPVFMRLVHGSTGSDD